MFRFFKFLLIDVLFRLARVVFGWLFALAHAVFACVWSAHVELFRNLFTDRASATRTLVDKPVRRS